MEENAKKVKDAIKENGLQHVARQRNFTIMTIHGAKQNILYSGRYFFSESQREKISQFFENVENIVAKSYEKGKEAHTKE